MATAEDEPDSVRLEAQAFGHALVNQAGRDLHVHYADGVRGARRATPDDSECPYPGLGAFGREQARWFFGRDRLIAELVSRLDDRLTTGGLQMVVAPSGAGKSSLLKAGLLTEVDGGALPGSSHWRQVVVTPTAQPEQVADLLRPDPATTTVVVVDQFEELFTLCPDPQRRQAFVDVLSELAAAGSGVLVVVGVRADFYAACANHAVLRFALQDRPVVVGPMSETELREAIRYPAQQAGLDVEPGLVELLLRDLGAATGEYEAGRLPLLAHTLRASWQQRHGSTLTVAGYEITGGIQRAIATTAEQVFATLNEKSQRICRSLLLRLVKIGEQTTDTRRRMPRAELIGTSADPEAASDIMDAFTTARLLTQSQDTVEITHEALLQSWPRLKQWMDTDRTGRLTHQNLDDAATTWERDGHDSSLLYRGARLEIARSWAATAQPEDVGATAQAFLAASVRFQRRATRLRTIGIAVLAVFALVASISAVVAVQQQSEATSQRDLAVYNRVLAEAARLRTADASLSAQLDLVAHRMRANDDTHGRIVSAAGNPLSTSLAGHTAAVKSVAFSPDGRTLASAGVDQTIRLWNIADANRATPAGLPLTGHTGQVNVVAFSPTGHLLASAGPDRTVRLWGTTDPRSPTAFTPLSGFAGTVAFLAFSADGRILATAAADGDYQGTVHLWNITDPAHIVLLGPPITARISAMALSPDGRTVVTADPYDKFALSFWDVTDPANAKPIGSPLSGPVARITTLAFTPDGHTLASGGIDQAIRLWNLTDRTHPAARPRGELVGHQGMVSSVAFSTDGHTLASAGSDRTFALWNTTGSQGGILLGSFPGHTSPITTLALGPDGRSMAVAGEDTTIRLFALPRTVMTGNALGISGVAYSPDGGTLAAAGQDGLGMWAVTDRSRTTPVDPVPVDHDRPVDTFVFSPDGRTMASGGLDGMVRLWNRADPGKALTLKQPVRDRTRTQPVAYSSDSRTLAVANDDGTVQLWDVSELDRPVAVGPAFITHTGVLAALAFSPKGQVLATAGIGETVRLWNVADPGHPVAMGAPLTVNADALAFSPDGRTLASGGIDQTIRIWDVADPGHAALLSTLTGHTNWITSVVFSPDGRMLASTAMEGAVRLWNLTDRARPVPIGNLMPRPVGGATSAAFSPDGHTLASTSADGMIKLWPVDMTDAAHTICANTDSLTPDDWKRYVSDEIPYVPTCP